MIRTITGALRAIKQARTPEGLSMLTLRLNAIAWNDGGQIRAAIEARRTELIGADEQPDSEVKR